MRTVGWQSSRPFCVLEPRSGQRTQQGTRTEVSEVTFRRSKLIFVESLRPGTNVPAVARRHRLSRQQLFGWRRESWALRDDSVMIPQPPLAQGKRAPKSAIGRPAFERTRAGFSVSATLCSAVNVGKHVRSRSGSVTRLSALAASSRHSSSPWRSVPSGTGHHHSAGAEIQVLVDPAGASATGPSAIPVGVAR